MISEGRRVPLLRPMGTQPEETSESMTEYGLATPKDNSKTSR